MEGRGGQLSLNGGSQDSNDYPHRTLQEFKEAGEAGRGQVIVTDAGLTLEGSGDWDPLLTQPRDWGGWAQAIVNISGLQFHLCCPTSYCQDRLQGGQAGEQCREGGASCPWDPVHLPRLSLGGLS